MHRREIERLIGKTREKGLTLIPTRIYFKGRNAKVEIALARGKDVGDKRALDQGARDEARDGPRYASLKVAALEVRGVHADAERHDQARRRPRRPRAGARGLTR